MRVVTCDVADGTESLEDMASTVAGRSVGWEGDE